MNTIEKIRKKRRKNAIVTSILVIVLAFLAFVSFKPPIIKTALVVNGTCENSIASSGYLIFEETVINSPITGVMYCNVSEEERVKKGENIASIYEGDINIGLQNKLNSLRDRISKYEKNGMSNDYVITDKLQLQSAIQSEVNDVVKITYTKNLKDITSYKDNINRLLDGSNSVKNDGKEKEISTLNSLKSEEAELKKQLNSKPQVIYSPVAGVFTTNIDGFENYFNPSKVEINDIKKANNKEIAKNNSVVKDSPIVKIINNYSWYYSCIIKASWLDNLTVNDVLTLRLTEISSNEIDATIYNISPEIDGKVAITLQCSKYVDDLFLKRKVKGELIKNKYSGLKVPLSAIHNVGDNNGVYVVKDGYLKFRAVNILHTMDTYVIVKENFGEKPLLLYDEVVTQGENLHDGEIVKV